VPSGNLSREIKLSSPIGMYMEISSRCNLNCGHCYKPEEISHEEMTLIQFKNLIDELKSVGVFEIRLCGNEPTASDNFLSIAQYIKNKGFYLGINTNGFFGDKKRKEFKEIKPDLIVVSIDGSEETHTGIRGKGVYKKALESLRYFKKLGIKCRINTVISKKTLKEISLIGELANELECDVSFLPFRPIGKHDDFNRDNSINCDEMKFAVCEIMKQREKFPNQTFLTYFDVLGEKSTYHHPIDKFNDPCPARKNGFITYSGDFFPCDFLRFAGERYYCGNVLKNGFSFIWENSSTLKSFQCLQHVKCKKCKFYMKSCYGGCISGSLASTGIPDDSLCFVKI
jgi:radical SAM protein with 4Fe4S-binding SPASM domain